MVSNHPFTTANTESPVQPKNSISFLRLIMALMVVFGHSYAIGGFMEPLLHWSIGRTSSHEMALQGFFILSGYLLSLSLRKRPSLTRFAIRRFFRIMPAFWVVLLLSAFVAAPLLTFVFAPGQCFTYFASLRQGDNSPLAYFSHNFFLLITQEQVTVGQSHLPLIANGSLWSLFFEGICYVILALSALIGLTRWRYAARTLFCVFYLPSVIYYFHAFHTPRFSGLAGIIFNLGFHPAGPSVVMAFVAGMAVCEITAGYPFWNGKNCALATLIMAIALTYGGYALIWPIALPYILLSLAYGLPFSWFNGAWDISYGVYLYAALIQNWLCLLGVQCSGLPAFLGASVVLSIAFGTLSWILVERPAIHLGCVCKMTLEAGNISDKPRT